MKASICDLRAWRCAALILAAAILAPAAALAEDGLPKSDWRLYSGDTGMQKYSPLDQINKSNVKDLKLAWRWSSPDNGDKRYGTYRYESTPIVVNGVMYVSGSSGKIAAINPATGESIWVYDPDCHSVIRRPTNLGWVHRGVTYWTDGKEERILIATGSAELIAVDAKTGKPCEGFGAGGRVDMTQGMRREVSRQVYAATSPPVVCRDVVAVGSSIFDGPTRKEMPPGDIRGFNVRTGEEVWEFHTVAQPGEFGHETWEEGSWEYTGNANCWSMMASDDELGYIYFPVGTPTNDWYGGHRKGDGLFGESLVCVEAATGKRVWHFQLVHHGLWDYDPPAGPILCDITVDGKPIKAVVQLTKHGFAFVFDRVTGKPVWPIEERPVPQSTVEGEKTSPTQPHPTKPAPYERQGVTEDDLVDFTPEIKAEAVELLKQYNYGPLFTPPSVKGENGKLGTIAMPGWQGGANWGGGAFDPETGILYVPSISSPILIALAKADPARSNFLYNRSGGMNVPGPKLGGKSALPIFKPPYGRVTAINLNTGEHVWMVPVGDGPRNHPLLKDLNLPPLGNPGRTGAIVTKTLLFIPDAAGGYGTSEGEAPKSYLRALDKATGETLHEVELASPAGGTPMTYMANGKQFVVFAIGGGRADSELAAFSLP